MDKDTFVSTSKNNFSQNLPLDDDNFFVQNDNIQHRSMPFEVIRHLNDYDSNILQEDAYKEVNDEIFKLEYKISKIEDELKNIDKQIQSARDIHDYFLADSLITRKSQLETELNDLTYVYKGASLSAKITGGFTSQLKKIFKSGQKLLSDFNEVIISKFPNKISSVMAIRNSLSKLENINKSVDDLMKYQHPYGEAGEKYEQLSRYIAKANSIQSEIYKFMK